MTEDNGRIEVGPCRCADAIHGEDWVELYPELTLRGGLRVAAALGSDLPATEKGPTALEALFTTEIRAWSFLDSDGRPVPIEPAAARELLPFARGGSVVANRLMPRMVEATQTDPFTVRPMPSSSGTGRTRKTKPSPASTSPSPSI